MVHWKINLDGVLDSILFFQFAFVLTRDAPVLYYDQEPFLSRIIKIVASRFSEIAYSTMHPIKSLKSILYGILDLGYLNLLIFFTVTFYMLVLLFCLFIYILEFSTKKADCVRVGSSSLANFDDGGQMFSGLFAISWTTLSTVGYGNSWPALSQDIDPDSDSETPLAYCPGINVLLMVEAFIGVCFAGACGAILFKKVVEIQSQAQVTFSQPVVIRFGSGLIAVEESGSAGGGQDGADLVDEGDKPDEVSCPCLEFRIVNLLHSYENGVISDASISCTVGIEEELNEEDERETIEQDSILSSVNSKQKDKVKRVQLPKKSFLDLEIVNNEHPHFKRVWTVFHILNENSPLLSARLRKRIKNNNGMWPKRKKKSAHDEAQFIAKNLSFEEIIVSFNGISKHTSCEVNAQKVYGGCDVVIGYKFFPILKKQGDDVRVLLDCINDITEQNGPDEPIPLDMDQG